MSERILITVYSLAQRTRRKCSRCTKRRLTTPTSIGPICNDCLSGKS